MRVALFTCVVVAHCVSTINVAPDVIQPAGLVSALLHVTRYGFVAVTLFVLVLSMHGRTMTPTQFWRRRFGLVIVPYLVWTLAYSISNNVLAGGPFSYGQFFKDLGRTTLTGDAKYQLYFLLISMQIYLAFPALMWLMGKVGGRPWRVLAVAASLQLAMFVFYQRTSRPVTQPWENLYGHFWKALPMYALFVAIGMLLALHHESVSGWLRGHVVPVVVCCVAAGALSVVAYLRATGPGVVPEQATTAWNPQSLPWYIAGVVLLWIAATLWDRLRASGRPVGERAVSYATVRAFGVFAAHPLVIDVLERFGFFTVLDRWFPESAILRSATLSIVVLAVSLVLVNLILRTPISRWVVARDRIPRSASAH